MPASWREQSERSAGNYPDHRGHRRESLGTNIGVENIRAAMFARNLLAGQALPLVYSPYLTAIDVAGEEIQDSAGENIVAIAGDHVSRAADIGELDLREACEKLVRALLTNEITHLSPNQKYGHAATQDRVDGGVHAIGVGDLKRRKRGGAADELRIPMPIPAIAAAA
jgi:hypothetical protein